MGARLIFYVGMLVFHFYQNHMDEIKGLIDLAFLIIYKIKI